MAHMGQKPIRAVVAKTAPTIPNGHPAGVPAYRAAHRNMAAAGKSCDSFPNRKILFIEH